ncbi:HAD family hydrolase [Aliarcobacter skirrowii]|uniref:phosphoglycolate phosphatase n=1 Tax=Aliarcobacter skirrowii CCUG 10374 TaxID=1032239 RepID=A0AAD0SML6_9BACT|nr:HAD family hydrolase [Aliarcobacter skirrowii]AXX84947.1 HAD superfamily hydrolase, probable phosphatase [Aliarcobacter skirrowii CCUG 10374]KAB0620518.1 HAD family hydrolase [Aliarcobacter skirrowii CCUG 10374]RXI25711.1 haloacid dehalogenase [Aliarcobacter skirrowii CCUG 10374]SUU96530.1 phosphoglycolate phosphatase [Aliarcobacter skirrowii]
MIKTIFWDFDGVILDSMPIRDYGFREIFKDFDKDIVDKLVRYHTLNGGLSRYVKIRYFYNTLLGQDVSDEKVQELANRFSTIMKAELTNKKYLIDETVYFIEKNYKNYNFHIVSGSDEKELNYLCKELEISKYFKTIEGSPTPKNDLVKNILEKYNYNSKECVLIGDSINDYEAANVNAMKFYGYNNEKLREVSNFYIEKFNNLNKIDQV